MLREVATIRGHQKIDWAGNITFALGATVLLFGITYGIEPYNGSPVGWSNPLVIGGLVLGVVLLALFVWVETRVEDPMFRLELFKIRMFSAGNASSFLASIARGGLQFMLVIWLQGIWLPLHGYDYAVAPLWAGIYMIPLMVGFLFMGPLSGYLSDRFGARFFSTSGMVIQALGFFLLTLLPANFSYVWFAIILFVLGLGQGMFSSPNTSSVMGSVPPDQRGTASGMRATCQNSGSVVSIGAFFSVITAGLAVALPVTLSGGLIAAGIPSDVANQIGHLPPTSALFAAFLGYNPISTLVPANVLHALSSARQATLLGHEFFPNLISGPFMASLHNVFYLSVAMCLVAAFASLMRGKRQVLSDGVVVGEDEEQNVQQVPASSAGD
jgi:MFS family permease